MKKMFVFCKDEMQIAKAKCRLLQNVILGGCTPKPLYSCGLEMV